MDAAPSLREQWQMYPVVKVPGKFEFVKGQNSMSRMTIPI
jgi:hypothetical protein